MPTSYEILQKRYSNEKFLQKAAARRDALEYEKISFGKLSPRKNYIRLLLPQAHSCFYFGNFQACISMCGMMLETILQLKVKTHFNVTGCIEYRPGPRKDPVYIKDVQELERLSLNDLIGVCYNYRYLKDELFTHLRNIQRIRNITIHDKMPLFRRVEDEYVLELGKREARYLRKEVSSLIHDTISLPAFYCLTKTREIFHALVTNIEE